MHTILGAGGPVANALTKELLTNHQNVKLASRKPVTGFDGSVWVQTDLLDKNAVINTVKHSSVIYLTAGLKYSRKIWSAEWPLIMQNVIDAAKDSGARVIFFDNVYSYGHVEGAMKENTPYQAQSVKGKIRAEVAEHLMNESSRGNINATIARAADFYGSESMNSFFDMMVFQKYAQGKKAMWIGDPSKKHSFTYVPDAAKAMYMLGQNGSSANQVWHMPTAPALTGNEFIELAAKVFGRPPKFSTINKFMMQMVGLFQPPIAESVELYYQYEYDYIFDSSRFEQAFNFKPTPYDKGFEAFSSFLKKQNG